MKDIEKKISLKCSVCANDQFSFVGKETYNLLEVSDNTEVKCSDCGRVATKRQMIEENNYIINENIEDLKDEAIKQVKRKLREMSKKWR